MSGGYTCKWESGLSCDEYIYSEVSDCEIDTIPA